MAQQFTIQSESIRDKLNSLLPSQNLGSIGVELTGSTQVVPIVDLTEVAEGSNLRQDLQTALSHASVTPFSVTGATTTIINTTGYFRVFGCASTTIGGSVRSISFILNDGTTDKTIWTSSTIAVSSTNSLANINFDFIVFLGAGDSLKITSTSLASAIGNTRQIATLSGELVNPI